MATALGEAYLTLKVRENLAQQMRKARRTFQENMRHMQAMAALTPSLNVAKFQERMRHLRRNFTNQMQALQQQADVKIRFIHNNPNNQALPKALQQAGFTGGGTGAMATAILTKGTLALANSMEELFIRGLEVNTALDRQKIVLNQLTGSIGAANDMLDELIKFDIQTPFDLTSLSDAARMLKATGVIGNREVIPMVKKLADAAAGSGGGPTAISHITLAISQMLSKGKIQSEEMTRQLSNAGIPAWKLLADAMGLSVAQVMKLSKEGKLGLNEINMLIDAIGKKYEGLAVKLGMGTIGDAMQVISSKFDLVLAAMSRPFKAPFLEMVKQLMAAMDGDAFKGFVAMVGDASAALGEMMKFLATNPMGQTIVAFGAIATGIGLVASALAGLVGGFVALAVLAPAALIPLGAMISIAPLVGMLAAGVTALGVSIYEAFNSEGAILFRANLKKAYDLVLEIGSILGSAIYEVVMAIGEAWQSVFAQDNLTFWESLSGALVTALKMVKELALWVKYIAQQIRAWAPAIANAFKPALAKVRMLFSLMSSFIDMLGGGSGGSASTEMERARLKVVEENMRRQKEADDAKKAAMQEALVQSDRLFKSMMRIVDASKESAAAVTNMSSAMKVAVDTARDTKDTTSMLIANAGIADAEKRLKSAQTPEEKLQASADLQIYKAYRAKLQREKQIKETAGTVGGALSSAVSSAVGFGADLFNRGTMTPEMRAHRAAVAKAREKNAKAKADKKIDKEAELKDRAAELVANAEDYIKERRKRAKEAKLKLDVARNQFRDAAPNSVAQHNARQAVAVATREYREATDVPTPKELAMRASRAAGAAITGGVNAIAGAGKSTGSLLGKAMSAGEDAKKGRSGFTGIADLSRQIQESILSSDETKDRKKMVHHLGGIDAGVAGVKEAADKAWKWLGKAL